MAKFQRKRARRLKAVGTKIPARVNVVTTSSFILKNADKQ